MDLSFIIPVHNHYQSLPNLLASIDQQCFTGTMEILIVDDCSDSFPTDPVTMNLLQRKDIRLIRLPKRSYTKEARLAGISEANGTAIAFADADDSLCTPGSLNEHYRLMVDHKADVVHFPMLNVSHSGEEEYAWASPLAESAEGEEVFAVYVRAGMRAHNVYTKLWRRDLCLRAMAAAKASTVRRYMEDFLLTSLFLFHARKYRGSSIPGYKRLVRDTKAAKTPGRLVTLSRLRHEFLDYIAHQGCKLHVLHECDEHLTNKAARWVREFHELVGKGRYDTENFSQVFLPHGTEAACVAALLEGHPLMRGIALTQRNTQAWRDLRQKLRFW